MTDDTHVLIAMIGVLEDRGIWSDIKEIPK